jgi:BLOC-1-related complex sub-unit 7
MSTLVAGLPISFSNDDAKANICSKAQSSINALAGLVKSIIKNSHTNDHLTTTLKQFATSDQQLVSTQDHIHKIEHTFQQLLFQSDILQLDTQELVQIQQTFTGMKLVEH